MSAVRLFSGADFILSEFTDIRTAASGITGVSWERLGGIMNRAVKRGLERRGDIPPLIIGLDEKQFFSRHRYFTIVTDPVNHCVYDVITDGRALNFCLFTLDPTVNMLITNKLQVAWLLFFIVIGKILF